MLIEGGEWIICLYLILKTAVRYFSNFNLIINFFEDGQYSPVFWSTVSGVIKLGSDLAKSQVKLHDGFH